MIILQKILESIKITTYALFIEQRKIHPQNTIAESENENRSEERNSSVSQDQDVEPVTADKKSSDVVFISNKISEATKEDVYLPLNKIFSANAEEKNNHYSPLIQSIFSI